MKNIAFALIAGFTSTAALAASADPVDQYLIEHGFKTERIESSHGVGSVPAHVQDPDAAYLVEHGFLSPQRTVRGNDQPERAESAGRVDQLLADWGFKTLPQSDDAAIAQNAPATDNQG